MAHNTGRGSRNAVPVRGVRQGTWDRRNTSTGVFAEAKARGGDFRGVRQPRRNNMSLTNGQKAAVTGLAVLACLGIILHFVLFILSIWALISGIIDWTQVGQPDAWILIRVIGGGIYILYTLFKTNITVRKN